MRKLIDKLAIIAPLFVSGVVCSNSPSQALDGGDIYSKMDKGVNWCDDGNELLNSPAECEAFAESTNDLVYQLYGNFTTIPSGCVIYGATNVYLNTNSRGTTHVNATLICKSLTSPWSKSPSNAPTGVPSSSYEPSFSTEPSQSSLPSHFPSTSFLPTTSNAPSPTYQQFSVMDDATNRCAEGLVPIILSECEGYANDTPGLTFVLSGSWPHGPKGCFVYLGVSVYFNSNPGSVYSTARLVCKPSYDSSSYAPSISFSPLSSPSSSPSAPRTHWWASNPLDILRGNNDIVQSVCFSRDGKWLVSGSRFIKVWNVQNGGEAIQTVSDEPTGIHSLDFNADGTKLVSGSHDNTVKLWDFYNNGTISLNNTFNASGVDVIKFSPDGKYTAAGLKDNTIKVWSIEHDGELIHTLTGHTQSIKALSFSPDGKVLVSGADVIKVWDTVNGWSLIESYNQHTGYTIEALDFSPDGAQLASADSDDKSVRIWDVKNSTLLPVSTLQHDHWVFAVKYSPDGQYLATGTWGNDVILWNRNDDYYLTQTLKGQSSSIYTIDFSPDGNKIASSGFDPAIFIWGIACSPGSYGSHGQCQPCAPGTFQPESDAKNCIPCPVGTFQSTPGAKQCEECSLGTFQPSKGQVQCEDCRIGGYCDDKEAANSCDGGFTACPIGTFNNVTGAFDEYFCATCPPGTFSDNKTALANCYKCPAGTYQDEEGKSKCIVCNSTSYQNRVGQTSCKSCPPGTYPDPSRLSCIDCPKGTYSTGGVEECSECSPGSVQSLAGQSTCEICSSGTYPDNSKVTCLQCPYRLGNEKNSDKCTFCADDFYLKVPNVKPEKLIADPSKFCLTCPPHAHCEKNTTIETLNGTPGFWRDSLQTKTFYECNDNTGICFGGTTCAKGHSGVRCEVCVDKNEYFDSSEGKCTTCPSFSKIVHTIGIAACILVAILVIRYLARRYKEIERFVSAVHFTAKAIGIQAKFKIYISFCQIIVTIQPVYGVHMHSAFTSWFKIFDIFNFGLAEIFGIPERCLGSMQARLLIGAGWPIAFALLIISTMFIYTIIKISTVMKRHKTKEYLAKFFSRSIYVVIVIFYLVLPPVCRQIFHARTCKSFESNDAENELSSYLIADWSVKCNTDNSDYKGVTRVFWGLFAIWPVAVPVGVFILILCIRPSVKSNSITPLAEACRFLWFDYNQDLMFWEVIEIIRKISLTGLIIFIDTEEGSERILRLLVATGICILYGTILSRARPYRRQDDFDLAMLSNLLLTCFFLIGIIIHQCKEDEEMDGENNICVKLFGISDSYNATMLAVLLTVAMILAFVLFTLILSVNEFKSPILRLKSTNSTPHLMMPNGCKYHLFVSHIWATGQDKVHKIVRMLKLYIQGIEVWLDVDVLKNLGDLETSVEESAHFILFYTQGYFKSSNCRREVVKAMKLEKPITVIFELDDIIMDKYAQMKEEFEMFWPQDSTVSEALNYIFNDNPIMWVSKGLQFSIESIKLVAGRFLRSLPYYEDNFTLLDAGMEIDGDMKSVEMFRPLDILYCSDNIGAEEVVMKLVQECRGDVEACAMNLNDDVLQRNNRQAVMLVYLNERVFQGPGSMLCDVITRAIGNNIQLVFAHENDCDKGGCAFWQIIEQTPEELVTEPLSIYSNDIAVSLYSTDEYQKVGLRQLLVKMGAKPIDGITISDAIEPMMRSLRPIISMKGRARRE